jgi:hypothetical protein
MIDNVKLTIRIFSIAVCVLLYVAAWVWFIITARDDSYNWDLTECRIFFLWVMFHVSCLIGIILWTWC